MDDDLFLSKVVEGCIAHGGLSARDGRRSPFVTGTDVVGWRSRSTVRESKCSAAKAKASCRCESKSMTLPVRLACVCVRSVLSFDVIGPN